MTWLMRPGSSFTSLRMRSIMASLPSAAAVGMGGGAARDDPTAGLPGQEHRFERAAAIDDGAIAVHRMQLGAARHLLADGDNLRRLGALADDGHTFLGIFSGQDSRQHQRHARRRRVRRIAARLHGGVAEQMCVDQRRRCRAAGAAAAAASGGGAAWRLRLVMATTMKASCAASASASTKVTNLRRTRQQRWSASRPRHSRSDSRSLPSFP